MKGKSELYLACEKWNHCQVSEILSAEGQASAHVFSDEFEKNMENVLQKRRMKYTRSTGYTIRKGWIAAAVFLLIFSLSMSVEASRSALVRFIMEMFEKYTEIQYDELDVRYAPDEIQSIREPDWGEGYEELYREENRLCVLVCKKNTKNDTVVRYTQRIIENEDRMLNTEHKDIEKIKGKKAVFWTEDDGNQVLIWSDGEYIYELQSHLPKKDLMRLANSVGEIIKNKK